MTMVSFTEVADEGEEGGNHVQADLVVEDRDQTEGHQNVVEHGDGCGDSVDGLETEADVKQHRQERETAWRFGPAAGALVPLPGPRFPSRNRPADCWGCRVSRSPGSGWRWCRARFIGGPALHPDHHEVELLPVEALDDRLSDAALRELLPHHVESRESFELGVDDGPFREVDPVSETSLLSRCRAPRVR